jgi:hypothetical protein
MLQYNEQPLQGKQDRDADEDFDLAVSIIAARFQLQPHIAKLVVGLAGLGAAEDRATASGGRAK